MSDWPERGRASQLGQQLEGRHVDRTTPERDAGRARERESSELSTSKATPLTASNSPRSINKALFDDDAELRPARSLS